MPETKNTDQTAQQQPKTPERGTAEAAQKERGKPAGAQDAQKEGASSRGREPISTQNRTSSEE
jgi:hypothetical protein